MVGQADGRRGRKHLGGLETPLLRQMEGRQDEKGSETETQQIDELQNDDGGIWA